MASKAKRDTASETALQAVEDALNIDFDEIENAADDRPADTADTSASMDADKAAGAEEAVKGAEEAAEATDEAAEFDPDFSELEQKLAEAANDLRRQSESTEETDGEGDEAAKPAAASGGKAVSNARESRRPKTAEPISDPADLLPANDERQNAIAGIVYGLQQKPPSKIYWIASLITLGWFALAAASFFYARNTGLLGAPDVDALLKGPTPWLVAAAAFIPVALIWAFAILVRRAQEMRAAAHSMTEAAIRLLQPEEMAAASVASVGRAIRREVAAISEGMERAIARAGELEQLVQSEVGNLERSYSDAEVRLKGLVGELAEERHEIVSHVDLLRESLADTHTGITTEVDAVAARIEAAVMATTSRIVNSLDEEGAAVTSNLETITGRLTEMLSQSGSQVAEAVALRAAEFDRMVQDRVSELDSTVENRLTGFGSVLDGRIETVFDKLSQQQTYVEDATTRIEGLVNEQISTAGREIGTRGVALVKALGTQTKALEKVLEDRSRKLGSVIGERLADFGGDVTRHMDDVVERLQERNDALEASTSRIEQTIFNHVERFDETMRERVLDVAKSFTSGKNVISTALDEAMDGVSAKALETKLGIEGIQAGMLSAMDERINAIAENLNAGHQRLVGELDKMDNRSTGLVAEIDKRTDRMGEMVSKAGYKLAAVIDQRTEAIQRSIAEGHDRLETELDKMDNRSTGLVAEIDKRTDRMGELVNEAGVKLAAVIEQRTEAIQFSIAEGQQRLVAELDKMDDRSTGLVAEIDKRAHSMGAAVNQAGQNLASVLDQRTEAIQRSIAEGQQRLVAELDKMDDRSTGLVAEIDKRAHSMGSAVNQAGQNLASVLEQRTEAFQRSVVDGQERLVAEIDKMDDRSSGLIAELDKRATSIGDMMTTASGHLLGQFDERALTIRQTMEEGHRKLFGEVDKIDERNSALLSDMEKQADRVGTSLRQASTDLNATFESGISLLRENIGEGQQSIFAEIENLNIAGSKLAEDIAARTEVLGDAMSNAAGHIGGVIDERNRSIFATLRQGRDEFLAALDRSSNDLVMGLDGKRAELAEQLHEHIAMTGRQIDSKAEALSNLLTERAHLINASLGNELVETQRTLETRTREFSDALAERARELNAIIDERAMPVVEGLRAGSSELIGEIERIGAEISAEFGNLIGNVNHATRSLDEMANHAGHSIGALEKNIVEGTSRLQELVEKASLDSENARQVAERTAANVSDTTEYLLNSLSGNSLKFEQQVKQLRDASESVTASQRELASVLETRQEPLEQLAENISRRSTAIEQSVVNFSSVLSGLIQDLMEKANTAGAKVGSEIESAFGQAMGRLEETVEAMRGASEEIRRELDATRTQMRRGVMELPVEVKESADTMRRVLVDQISALKELSDIVTKSGKAYDAAPPTAQQQQPRLAVGGGGMTTARATGGQQPVRLEAISSVPTGPAPRAHRAPAPDMRPETHDAPLRASFDTLGDPHRGGEREADRTAGFASQRVARRPSVQPSAPEGKTPAQGSWVSELLRRASREEDRPAERAAPSQAQHVAGDVAGGQERQAESGRPPLHAIESLNSLSMDIARAIDHNASVDLWERYQRGERNVFTRRLYTLQGQKTFDEIRAKYSRDSEFRTAVDRYIADFERLLADVGRNDRDNMMTQTYLTSDTGKVYTMLAHAAGRFGNA